MAEGPAQERLIVPRRFTRLNPDRDEFPEPKPFEAYAEHPAIVVLGEPGMGKTTLLRRLAEAEPDAQYVKVGPLLHGPFERFKGKTLYIDALDEHRRRIEGGASSIERVMGRLLELGQPRFRLTCRAADWYGESDVASLAEAAEDDRLCVLQLLPLLDEDVEAIVTAWGQDGAAFLRTSADRGVSDWLGNPLNLELLLEVVQESGWPENRAELYALGVRKLVQEQNPDHARANRNAPTVASLEAAAGYVCAALLLSGQSGAALSPAGASHGFLELRSLPALADHPGTEQNAVEAVVRSRLFTSDGTERTIPFHRALAEYLAARFLAYRVRNGGLPLRRVLALLQGLDGSPPTELRGLYAWFVTLLPGHADLPIPADPLGLILYGDASLLSHQQRINLLVELEQLESRHPGYRHEARYSEPFGSLGTPDMEPVFREILSDAARPPMLVACVFDALTHGASMPALSGLLLNLVRDNARPAHLRSRALDAYRHQAPKDTASLRVLLDDIHAGTVTDPGKRLRGEIISTLYPTALQPSDVLQYIVPEDPDDPIGSYHMAVEFGLPEPTPVGDLPGLLDALAEHGPFPKRGYRRTGERMVGQLIVRGLEEFGDGESAARLFDWLGSTQGEFENTIREEEEKTIRAWLEAHPDKFKQLLLHWLAQADTSARIDLSYVRDFQPRVLYASLPADFTESALQSAIAEPDDARAAFLFRLVVQAYYDSKRYDAAILARFHAIATDHPRFADVMQEMSFWSLGEHHWEWRLDQARRKRRQAEERANRISGWNERIEGIHSGQDANNLTMLALYYFGHVAGQSRRDDPMERLSDAAGIEVTAAALDGFVAALYLGDLPGPRQLGEMDAQNKRTWGWYLPIAGVEALYSRDPCAVRDLPEQVIGVVVATLLATDIGNRVNQPWMQELVHSRPEIVADALSEFWHGQLEHGEKHLAGTYALKEPWMRDVTRQIVPNLLQDFPSCAVNCLESFLEAALVHCEGGDIKKLAMQAIKGELGEIAELQLTQWYAIAYLLSPEQLEPDLRSFVERNRERAGGVLHTLVPHRTSRRGGNRTLTVNQYAVLLETCVSQFEPMELRSGWVPPEYATTEAAEALITNLSNDPDPQATASLTRLEGLPEMAAWRTRLAHAKAQQLRRRRDAEYHQPTVEAVVETLASREPANAADLQAVVSEHLLLVKKEIEDGGTDRGHAFWNTDKYGKPIPGQPKIENECRDRLLDWLRPLAVGNGINAEREGDYAQHKRADIKCSGKPPLNLPIEIKRQNHPDLWLAPQEQLVDRYSRDPGADGRGIYLVLWYGPGLPVTPRPDKAPPPSSADELRAALEQVLPDDLRRLVEVIVIDVSPRNH